VVRIQILGPLAVTAGGRRVECEAAKPRTVLGLLLCRANRIVPVPVLRQALWDDAPPRAAQKNLQSYVSTLRAMLTDGVELHHRPPGYLLRIGPDQLDALHFADLTRQGRQAARDGATEATADLLGRALRLWRGPALPDLVDVPVIGAEVDHLMERRLTAYEDWAEASLTLGRDSELIDELDEVCWEHPFRERLRHAQMLALYRAGRQAEALARFAAVRQALARELGLGPGPLLTRLHDAILSGDPGLDVDPPGRARPSAPRYVAAEVDLLRDVADFTGRARPAAVLGEVLSTGPPAAVVTVTGAAGVGKTALAVHATHRLGARYPDGRVLVRLRAPDGHPRAAPDVLAELARALGYPLPDVTVDRRVLLVLDDADGPHQLRPLLAAAGDAAVLITARRRPAGLADVHLGLEPMTGPESVDLLGRLAGPARVAADPVAALRLAAACGGLPLVLRVAGAKLAALPHLTLARYADRLADGHQLLDQLAAGDPQVVRRLDGWLAQATPEDRAALHRLATGGGPEFTMAEAGALLGVDSPAAEAAVERLVEGHFAEVRSDAEVQAHAAAPTRFALHGPLRAAVLRAANAD